MMSTAQGATMSPQHPKRRVTQQHQVQVMPVQAIQVSYSMTNVGGINPNLESYLMNLAIDQVKFLRFLRGRVLYYLRQDSR